MFGLYYSTKGSISLRMVLTVDREQPDQQSDGTS